MLQTSSSWSDDRTVGRSDGRTVGWSVGRSDGRMVGWAKINKTPGDDQKNSFCWPELID